jgi:hypothetical protein
MEHVTIAQPEQALRIIFFCVQNDNTKQQKELIFDRVMVASLVSTTGLHTTV